MPRRDNNNSFLPPFNPTVNPIHYSKPAMKSDIILAGVGGQGILSIATILGAAALANNLHVKQAEVHGMSQRGGDVQSNLRLSSRPIHSDLIARGSADLIVSLEPMEALRYLPYLKPDGVVVTNTVPVVNIPDYPAMEQINSALEALPRVVAFDMDAAAKAVASVRSANMVLLGAAVPFIDIPREAVVEAIRTIFGRKGQAIVDANIAAFNYGVEAAEKVMKA